MSVEKLAQYSRTDFSWINSFHFLYPKLHIPLKDSAYYTFAYNDSQEEICYALVKRTMVEQQSTLNYETTVVETQTGPVLNSKLLI